METNELQNREWECCCGTSCIGCKKCNYNYEGIRGLSSDWKNQSDQLYAAEARYYFFYYTEQPELLVKSV